jgi:hypothetical protein
MPLPLTVHQWMMLVALAGLVLLDAILAWIRNAAQGSFSWAKVALYIRKQFYIIGAGIALAVMHKDAPAGWQSATSVVWWTGAITVALQYVVGDILGTKLGIVGTTRNGVAAVPPK